MDSNKMVTEKPLYQPDFWWLTPEEVAKYRYVCVGHHESYSDEPNSDRTPLSVDWFYSIDAAGKLSNGTRHYPLEFINHWRAQCQNTNVFRSVGLFTAEQQDEDELLGPFVIDIDRDNYKPGKGYTQNLDDAREATFKIVTIYLENSCQVKERDFRIFFTGHKGFNIEVLPSAFGLTFASNGRQVFEDRLEQINKVFGGNSMNRFVDRFHYFIRLHNSINSWVGNDGNIVYRRKLELSFDELNSLSVEEICRKAES